MDCVDTSREPLADDTIRGAAIAAFYLPMHTATRLAAPLIERVREVNPAAQLVACGLYAAQCGPAAQPRRHHCPRAGGGGGSGCPRQIPQPKSQTPNPKTALHSTRSIDVAAAAAIRRPADARRLQASGWHPDATRGCKHLCRHCPIVPVYRGAFRAIADDVVLADVAAQVAAG